MIDMMAYYRGPVVGRSKNGRYLVKVYSSDEFDQMEVEVLEITKGKKIEVGMNISFVLRYNRELGNGNIPYAEDARPYINGYGGNVIVRGSGSSIKHEPGESEEKSEEITKANLWY